MGHIIKWETRQIFTSACRPGLTPSSILRSLKRTPRASAEVSLLSFVCRRERPLVAGNQELRLKQNVLDSILYCCFVLLKLNVFYSFEYIYWFSFDWWMFLSSLMMLFANHSTSFPGPFPSFRGKVLGMRLLSVCVGLCWCIFTFNEYTL